MTYLSNTPESQRQMLEAIGVESLEPLFSAIPPALRLQRELDLPPAMGELELAQHMGRLAAQNRKLGNGRLLSRRRQLRSLRPRRRRCAGSPQ